MTAKVADIKTNLSEDKNVVKGNSLTQDAIKRLKKDKLAMFSIFIIAVYSIIALFSALGIVVPDWSVEVGGSYLPPSSDFLLGTDFLGRDVLAKVLNGTKVAMSVGLISSLIAIPIGVGLGAVAGYYGGKIDELVVWFYTTVSSIPNIMLLISISFILGKGMVAVYIALGLTSWVTLCRLIRGEVMRHKDREYIQAATAIGGGDFRKLIMHILPNVSHIIIINFSLQFQIAIKSEVILSYLGLGIQGKPSWGTMINDAKDVLSTRGVWWEMTGATVAMFLVVLAFNILGDSLRDSLDPKLKGK